MNITVQGRSAEKDELDATDWITVLNKCNLEEKWARKAKLASEEVKVIDTPSPKRDGKQQAEKSIASNQVKLPENGWRIIFRPKGGMVVKQYDGPTLTEAIHVTAKIEWNKACQLVKNEKQGIFVFFTPSTEARDKLLRLTHLDIEGKVHEMTVHLAVPDDFSRGVIHGIGLNTSLQKIKQGIAEHEENPKVLEIRRLGQSKTIMLTFTTKEVPRTIKCLGAILNCYLYKKKYDVCYKCGDLGHRSDVCESKEEKCRGCGIPNPTEGHDCNPTCKLCGQPHLTGDKTCKEIFRTPYIVKKRQWEKLQQQEEEEKLSEHRSRRDESKTRAPSKERLRSTSFPRLPQQATTTPPKKQGAQQATTTPPKKQVAPPTKKVGWEAGNSHDSDIVRELKEQMKQQHEMMKQQQEQWKLYQEQTQAQMQELRNHVIELQRENNELKAQLRQPEAHQEAMDDKSSEAETEAAAPPKKKRVKKIDSGLEKAEGRVDKLEVDMQQLKEVVQQVAIATQRNAERIDQLSAQLSQLVTPMGTRMDQLAEQQKQILLRLNHGQIQH
ncbi:hypothetical protein HPB49_023874 [Dermacentor silvarum]|uniref:Uncharacterized protein n=1 Tax=Dermacentor silvarum TaxID=543639 RepID=A0ACB8E3U3_DERSI|nr:hypothetical protein HPB49_023874 [Dermacentor silvarum]